jgi:hypothetical protein
MALGTVKSTDIKRSIVLMAASTANVAAPTLATDGVPTQSTKNQKLMEGVDVGAFYYGRDAGQSTLMIKGRVTAAQTLVGTFTLWGYLTEADAWFEIPVNGGTAVTPTAMAETTADQINFQQRFENLGHYDRIALELAAIGGTGATFSAWLVTGRYGE